MEPPAYEHSETLLSAARRLNRGIGARSAKTAAATWLAGTLFAAVALAQGTLETEDGLALSLSTSGGVQSLKLNGVEYASPSLPSGFAYRELPATPNDIAPNGSFEAGSGTPTGWSISGGTGGAWSIDTSTAAAGTRSMKLAIPGTTELRSPDLSTAKFPLLPNTLYALSASMMSSGLSIGLTVYLVQQDATGKGIQTGIASLSGTSDWRTYNTTISTRPDTVQGFLKAYISSGYGTVWVDNVQLSDIFGGNGPTELRGTVTSSGGVLTQTASKNGLNLSAKFTSAGEAIKVDATLTDTTGADRAMELSYRLPLDIAGWIWDNDFVTPMTIATGSRYENLDTVFAAQTKGHAHSVYPFATVRNSAAAFSLAVPMGPLMDSLSYDDSDGFRITYDLGLSRATTKNPSKAAVSFWIYTQNPKWGLRSAAEKYYVLNPMNFTSSASALGAWAIANSVSLGSVPTPQDFGWAYDEGGELHFDNANGIVGLHYVSPTSWTRKFSEYVGQPQPSYSILVAALQKDVNDLTRITADSVPVSKMATSVIDTSPYDENGLQQLDYNGYYWRSSGGWQMYPTLPDPDIPGSRYDIVKQYSVDNQISGAQKYGNTLGGVFLDNITSNFGNVENYRKPLWAYLNTPLSFSYATRRLTAYGGDSIAKFCASLRRYLHGQGLILMGSVNSGSYVWFASGLDVLGGEAQGADPINTAYVRRTMSYGKLWTNLFVPADFMAPDMTQVLTYLRQALLLGYFPGFNGTYWDSPPAYERDRPLFRQYIPLIRTIAAAGWRPVNAATPSDPAIYIERFDDGKGETFYLTAQNTGGASKGFQVRLDAPTLAVGSGSVAIQELLRNKAVGASREGTDVLFSDTLGPGETFVYRITAPRPTPPRRGPTRHVAPRG